MKILRGWFLVTFCNVIVVLVTLLYTLSKLIALNT